MTSKPTKPEHKGVATNPINKLGYNVLRKGSTLVRDAIYYYVSRRRPFYSSINKRGGRETTKKSKVVTKGGFRNLSDGDFEIPLLL